MLSGLVVFSVYILITFLFNAAPIHIGPDSFPIIILQLESILINLVTENFEVNIILILSTYLFKSFLKNLKLFGDVFIKTVVFLILSIIFLKPLTFQLF